jgi:hypothetical protein
MFTHAPPQTDAGTLPEMEAADLERLALAVSATLRRRLSAQEEARDAAPEAFARAMAEDAARELEWLLARVDLQIAVARERAGGRVALDPRLHAVLTAGGKLVAFRRGRPARGPDLRDRAA